MYLWGLAELEIALDSRLTRIGSRHGYSRTALGVASIPDVISVGGSWRLRLAGGKGTEGVIEEVDGAGRDSVDHERWATLRHNWLENE
jgi:hypothetical protein